jgi:hypothetical protein
LKKQHPPTDRRTGRMNSVKCAVGRVALESTSAAFQTAANPSQLPTHENDKAQ